MCSPISPVWSRFRSCLVQPSIILVLFFFVWDWDALKLDVIMECASRPLAWWPDPPASRHHESLPFASDGGGWAPYIELKRNSVLHRSIAHLLGPVRLRSLVHLYSFYIGAWSVCDVAGSWYLKFMAGTESYTDRGR